MDTPEKDSIGEAFIEPERPGRKFPVGQGLQSLAYFISHDFLDFLPILGYHRGVQRLCWTQRKQVMQDAKIKGFFNPRFAGDTFTGLCTMDGRIANRIHGNLFEFLKDAGRDYFIRKVPAGVLDPTGGIGEGGILVPSWIEVGNQFHLARSSDNRVVSPHTVTDSYAPVSLMDMAEELQPWCEQGWCSPDGVYSARGESLEVLSLRLDAGGIEFPGKEKFHHYIVWENAHAVGGKGKGKIISWRIVCKNTFAAAISARSDFMITHRVAKGSPEKQQEIMAERVKEAVAAWSQVKDYFQKMADKIGLWQGVSVTKDQAVNLSNRLIGIDDEEDASTRATNKRDAIVAAFNLPSAGTEGRTAWDWINAVTFVNSSPDAEINKKSKVDATDRLVRTTTVNGTGFKEEASAEKILADFIG